MSHDFNPLSAEERLFLQNSSEQNYSKNNISLLLLKQPSVLFAFSLLIVLLGMAITGPFFFSYSYSTIDLLYRNQPPSLLHIFGTDDLGRDVFIRCCYGLRISLFIGTITACIDTIIGITWGMIAGYKGGAIDRNMMKIAEVIYSLPYLLLAIFLTAVIGPGTTPVILTLFFIGWIQMARVTRHQVTQIKGMEFVQAAIALGARPIRVIFHHILPNIIGPLIASSMLSIPYAIFSEAFLSFLGIGLQPPLASLGSMVSDGLSSIQIYPWRLFFPSCCISCAIFACNLLGDTLRDLLDPQHRKYLEQPIQDIL